MKKALFFCLSVLLLTACTEQKQTTQGNKYYPEEVDEDTSYVTLEEARGDSMLVGSTTYSVTERELGVLLYNVEEIKSTYMLQLVLLTYEFDLQRGRQSVARAEQSGACSDEERTTLRTTLSRIEAAMDEKLDKYTVPADGVIGNLNYLLRNVNKAKTKEELKKILDGRSGYIQTLPSLHLIVQEPSKQREVHRLAKELQRAVERQEAELR